jgi:hypothetical protein
MADALEVGNIGYGRRLFWGSSFGMNLGIGVLQCLWDTAWV